MLVALEGIDGTGKETQTRLLVDRLNREHITACAISFPRYGSTTAAQGISSYLNGEFGPLKAVDPQLAGLLFATDRFESRGELADLESRHTVVVCDRYVASNVAHQVSRAPESRRKKVREWLEQIEYETFSLPRAALTVLLDLDPATARQAAEQRGQALDIHERDDEYLSATREAYLALAEDPTWRVIACAPTKGSRLDVSQVAEAIWSAVADTIAPAQTRL